MMKRSQIYLPAEQWRRLGALSHQRERSISELIRQALDKVYSKSGQVDFAAGLHAVAGLWKGHRKLPDTPTLIRRLRRGGRLER